MSLAKVRPGGTMVKNPPASAGDPGSIPGSGRFPGEGNGYPLQYSRWEIPWTEEPRGLQSMGSQRARHDWVTEHTHRSPQRVPNPVSLLSIQKGWTRRCVQGKYHVKMAEKGWCNQSHRTPKTACKPLKARGEVWHRFSLPALLTPWSCTASHQDSETIRFCFSHSALVLCYSSHSKLINTSTKFST